MNNLHRKLAPVSEAAWAEIEEEASRTLKRHLAARRVVDVSGPEGLELSAIGTGHTKGIDSPGEGVQAVLREVYPVVEFRIPFELSRQAIDDVERGSEDSDWQPLKDAARKIAFAEDRAVFEGYAAAGIAGVRKSSTNAALVLPASIKNYSETVAKGLAELRLAGVNGPYVLVLGADAYTAASGGSDEGYPEMQHLRELVDGEIIWAPAIEGGFLFSTRGGDFELSIGQDLSIGYLSHNSTAVQLYLQETFTFRVLTTEAVVCFSPAAK